MGKRIDLHNKFVEILGSRNVYYQPPENLKMEYPAIRYSLNDISSTYANNSKYYNNNRYDVIVISKLPDNEAVQKILELPYSSFDRRYINNGLYHDVLTLYF